MFTALATFAAVTVLLTMLIQRFTRRNWAATALLGGTVLPVVLLLIAMMVGGYFYAILGTIAVIIIPVGLIVSAATTFAIYVGSSRRG